MVLGYISRGRIMIAVLAGGVGAARFLQGLVRVVDPKDIKVIVNTADDIDIYGVHVSPDVDIVTYTLAGVVDEDRGWGIKGDTFNFVESLARFGLENWFKLGDMDLATCFYRTMLMKKGFSLTEATHRICRALNVEVEILPMTDHSVQTYVETDIGVIHIQEYMVKYRCEPSILGVEFKGIGEAEATAEVLEALEGCSGVIVCPSNPVISIGPILSVKGIRDKLRGASYPKVAVTPIIAGAPVKGPADKFMRFLGVEVSPYGVAWLYRDFLDGLVVDIRDSIQTVRIEKLGIKTLATDTLMRSIEDKVRLAKAALNLMEIS
ncbi:MAG: 2-phospho-L-lactate transferase [Nitrososphaerota archaeon]|nr:2-phospho-L-lactate transferase [Candidatus Bathyarchaeota archaeon]MDW8061799.1 2-phospho-L-lactate transferase [Nitrososphaerota archaeon]